MVNRAFLIQYSLDHPGGKELAAVEDIRGKTDYDLSPAFLADQFRHDDEQFARSPREYREYYKPVADVPVTKAAAPMQ